MNAGEQWDADQTRLHELIAVSEVEVADVRMGDLTADQAPARRHHRSERPGDPALKDCGADKIAAAQQRERRS